MAKKYGTLSWASVGVIASVVLHALASMNPAMAAPAGSTAGVQGLVRRLLPSSYHQIFDFQLVDSLVPSSPDNVHDVFRVSNKNAASGSRILIEGTSVSALTRGLKFYLEEAAQVNVEWSGNRLRELPRVPPALPGSGSQTRGSFVPYRYYTNVVSYGYQFPFWDWKRWEKEIDWMALNGINLLPAYVGQEYVFREFYRSLNLTDTEIGNFFAGPSYMPWQRMGNIQNSWNHNLLNTSEASDNAYKHKWIDEQWALQQLILSRLSEVGITPALPTFQAFVPKELPAKFPNTTFKKTAGWSDFPAELAQITYVQQTEPLFAELQTKYLQLQDSLNKGHKSKYYMLDLYNDVTPDCTTPQCLSEITTAVTKSLQAVDKDAVWVMQGWFLTAAWWKPDLAEGFFKGIKDANGTAFVFDLSAEAMPGWEATNGFYGNDFGWSLLNNFGTLQGLFGNLPKILTDPFNVYKKHKGSFKGIGVTAEGIYNNEYLYNTVFELAWHDPNAAPIDAKTHLEQYIRRRYGPSKATTLVQDAVDKLRRNVWNSGNQLSNSKSFVEKVPALEMAQEGLWMPSVVWYNKTDVVQAWDELTRAALQEQYGNVAASWKFDLVDTTREVLLSTVFPAIHEGLVAAYKAKDLGKVRSYGQQLLALIRDTDRVLNTSPYFSLNTFIRDARNSFDPTGRLGGAVRFDQPGLTKAGYQLFLESNVRNIFTWWGRDGSGHQLPDYASKQWGGMLSSYYYPRWQLFIQHLQDAVVNNKSFDQGAYDAQRLQWEAQWQGQPWGRRAGETLSTNGQEPTEVVREVHGKYHVLAAKVAAGGKA